MQMTTILQEHNINYKEGGEHHHVTAGYIGIDCPYCSPNSNKFRMGFNLARKFFICWVCGWKPIIPVLEELTGKTRTECHELFGGIDFGKAIVKPSGKLVIPEGVRIMESAHRKYLWKERGLDPSEMEVVWGLKGIGIAPRLQWRLFIPITLKGQLVSWTTRAINKDADVPYVNAKSHEESLPAKSLLYGEDLVRGHSIIICEGPGDAWAIGPGAVATMGVGYSKKQLSRISKYPKRIICFDNEKPAQRRAAKLCADLELLPGTTINVCLDSKDAGEASPRELKKLRKLLK